MNRCKQGIAAITLATALGLVAPSSLGGVAFADVSAQNPNRVETTLSCEIGNEVVSYDVTSTWNAAAWQDKNSTTILNVIYSTYEGVYVAIDPPDPNDTFAETGASGPGYPHGGKKGRLAKAVVCHSVGTETWTSDGSLGIAGHTYAGVIDNTWHVTISDNNKKATAKSASVHDNAQSTNRQSREKSSKHRGKGKRG